MNHSFCAAASQQTGEDTIGTAGHYQTYVLIECPYPWAADVFESTQIPLALRQFIAAARKERSVQFLCINRQSVSQQITGKTAPSAKLLVYEAAHPSEPTAALSQKAITYLTNGYRGFELSVGDLEQAVDCLQTYWQGLDIGKPISDIQDVLVCTHGRRDRCCAYFGQRLFKAAEQLVAKGSLPQVRVWRVSHIGGHRFAPTAIILPEGRCYGRLTISALQALLTRTGDPLALRDMYRGWGLLPKPLQVLERQLFLQLGWAWLSYRLSYRVVDDDGVNTKALLAVASPEGEQKTYQAKVARSHNPSHRIHTDCNADKPYIPVQYSIVDFTVVAPDYSYPSIKT